MLSSAIKQFSWQQLCRRLTEPTMHDILKFHNVHGSAVVLSEGGNIASRTEDSFCNGIVFSAKRVKIGQKFCLELSSATEWSGAIRIGVTRQDPGKMKAKDLPRYVCPDLTSKDGTWARALNEKYGAKGNRITCYVNAHGQMHYFVNNEHKGIFLSHIPTSGDLWVVFDLYGNTTSAKFVQADEAPVEILARGPDAMRAYHSACECGTQPVFRTRLMLVGQDRVGKTSLKNALTGQRHNREEESTDGIDLSASCSFNLGNRSSWKLALHSPDPDPSPSQDTPGDDAAAAASTPEQQVPASGAVAGAIVSTTGMHFDLEEEYHTALATNIVQELLYKQRQAEREMKAAGSHAEGKHSSAGSRGSASTASSSSASSSAQKNKDKQKKGSVAAEPGSGKGPASTDVRSQKLLQEMPDRVVKLVEEMMREKEMQAGALPPQPGSEHLQSSHQAADSDCESGKNIVLNIWDFAGQAAYYTTHQVFLSSRAVYIIVFNLLSDLDEMTKVPVKTPRHGEEVEWDLSELTYLDYMDYWMNSIHAHAAQNTRNSVENNTLSPPIFIVGTHRNGLSDDPAAQEKLSEQKFNRIRLSMEGKSYQRHIVPLFFAVENSMEESQDEQIVCLRRHIEEVASKEPYMGEQMPIKWLRFEQAVARLVDTGTYFSSLDQVCEVAREEGIMLQEELCTLLEFLHDLGVIVHYSSSALLDTRLHNTVILKPQWLINMFKRVITAHDLDQQLGACKELWHRLDSVGVLEERLLDTIWSDALDQKPALLGLMDKFDLIAETHKTAPGKATADKLGRSFYIPSRLQLVKFGECPQLYSPSKLDVVFYVDFHGFCPDGLFHRVLTRAIRWSQSCGGHEPQLQYRNARFFLDSEHDFLLQMSSIHLARIKVIVLRVVDLDEVSDISSSDSDVEKPMPPPRTSAAAKVRNFLESTLSDLRELWMKRLSYMTCVMCYCDQPCLRHSKLRCPQEDCLHFLNLDECIANKVVFCEHRRIKTSVYRKWFPSSDPLVKAGPVLIDSVVQTSDDLLGLLDTTKGPDLPGWVRSTAKLLNGGSEGQDWMTLAGKLGYKKGKTDKFSDDLNPGLALITDWIVSSGNTSLSVDMMITCLEQMQRDDIVEIIQKGQEAEVEPPQVFISYQWDSQDEVNALRDRLEKAGYSCWMDIGQMGGGDHLYSRIDDGIRNAKVVVACLTPKYIVSQLCNREVSLADLLCKPILPVMYAKTPWPPPGGMSLMFSQLVYINMKGVGGHGGSGIHADLENKYQEILQRVSNYATAYPRPRVEELSPRFEHPHKSLALPVVDHPAFHGDGYESETRGGPVIPGYGLEVVTRNPGGRTLPGSSVLSRHSAGTHHDRSQAVEQVHVTKCAVCLIL